MPTQRRTPQIVTVEPTGAVTQAPDPISVVARYTIGPPFGDGHPLVQQAEAIAWTTAQVLTRLAWPGGPVEVWLPARDILRPRDTTPRDVVARVRVNGQHADVPSRLLAEATNRADDVAAVLIQLAPDTTGSQQRWLLAGDLVDVDPLDDVAS